ncbi:MAG: TRAP transporter substrate-binding protein [Hydrogenophaga sp.]|uniref:TRAP transporter substrate-binding protein n=1 Tax=Hydrogenophaga sp. TaxID=1904254 RepID=UPI004034FE8E
MSTIQRWLAATSLVLAGALQPVLAQSTVTLKVHHYLPPYSLAQKQLIEPWCERISAQSAGRLKCQIFPAMQMGGTPPQLFDQAKDGVADVVWTLPGYQAGRFPLTEVFELPFITSNAERSSRALWRYVAQHSSAEFAGVRPLVLHVNDGFLVHTTGRQIKALEDFRGLKLRAATRLNAKLITALGAAPISMPMPPVPEALSKKVIDGAILPWEVIPALKLQDIVKFHTDIDASLPRLSNTVFAMVMNNARYDSLPADLKKVIDANSGEEASALAGKAFDAASVPARKTAEDRNNVFHTVPVEEARRWMAVAQPITDEWVKEVTARGQDGRKLLDAARAAE